MSIDIEATITKLEKGGKFLCPETGWSPLIEEVVSRLLSLHIVHLETLKELRLIRERMNSDVACGFRRSVHAGPMPPVKEQR